ncbi:hypothetical protein EDB87DRAFT_1581113 [Lactarius vividus]|nr:hypothetical protein EDB87DRAFT_1581113 [Lactarius vividus]
MEQGKNKAADFVALVAILGSGLFHRLPLDPIGGVGQNDEEGSERGREGEEEGVTKVGGAARGPRGMVGRQKHEGGEREKHKEDGGQGEEMDEEGEGSDCKGGERGGRQDGEMVDRVRRCQEGGGGDGAGEGGRAGGKEALGGQEDAEGRKGAGRADPGGSEKRWQYYGIRGGGARAREEAERERETESKKWMDTLGRHRDEREEQADGVRERVMEVTISLTYDGEESVGGVGGEETAPAKGRLR